MKNSFVLYTAYQAHIELLSMEQRGVLLTAIMAHAVDAELPEMDGMTKMAFSFIREDLDRAADKYEKTCEARRKAGCKGGRPKKEEEEKAKKANGFFEKQTKAKKPDNDNDNENENENENEKEDDSSATADELTRKRVVETWNSQLEPLGITPVGAIKVGTKRAQMLRARVKEYGLAYILDAIRTASECSYLRDVTWFNIDWFLRPNNFQKVAEGNYRDRKAQADRMSWVDSWAGGEVYDQR